MMDTMEVFRDIFVAQHTALTALETIENRS